MPVEKIDGAMLVELTKLESRIETILNPSSFRQAVQAHAPQVANPVQQEELPVIQQEDEFPPLDAYPEPQEQPEINVEDIPFN